LLLQSLVGAFYLNLNSGSARHGYGLDYLFFSEKEILCFDERQRALRSLIH
jgi:hypothetical protein